MSLTFITKKFAFPINVFVGDSACVPPNAKAYPTVNHATEAPHASKRFFSSVFWTFFFRTAPAHTIAKPACMTKTSAAAKSNDIDRAKRKLPMSGCTWRAIHSMSAVAFVVASLPSSVKHAAKISFSMGAAGIVLVDARRYRFAISNPLPAASEAVPNFPSCGGCFATTQHACRGPRGFGNSEAACSFRDACLSDNVPRFLAYVRNLF